MSYCVNCGVELSEELRSCPLCQTPVYHLEKEKNAEEAVPVFPRERGEVDVVRNDVAVLFSVVLISTCLACGALNLLVFRKYLWSVYVIGGCGVLWVASLPLILVKKPHALLALLADGMAVSLYCALISWFHPGKGWFLEVALPVVWLCVVFVGIFVGVAKKMKPSILAKASLLFAEAGIFTVFTELVLNRHFAGRFYLSWSAVTGICCFVIVAALITIIRRSGLREEVRRRMHI